LNHIYIRLAHPGARKYDDVCEGFDSLLLQSKGGIFISTNKIPEKNSKLLNGRMDGRISNPKPFSNHQTCLAGRQVTKLSNLPAGLRRPKPMATARRQVSKFPNLQISKSPNYQIIKSSNYCSQF
jgi:hypothetical protein